MLREQGVRDPSKAEVPLPRWKVVLICLAMCLGAVTVGIDAAIISPAVPFFAEQWHSFNDIGWYGAAYILPQIVLQPLYGRLLYFIDTKWSYLTGILGLQVGSIICALSSSSAMFIAGRAVAGISVAMLTPAGMDIINHLVAKQHRPLFVACVFASMAVSTFGSVLGGFFAQSSNWRWMFFLNFPVGAAVALLIIVLLPRWPSRGKAASWVKRLQHLDLLGCVLLISALIALCMSLHFVATTLSWTAPSFIGCIAAFVGLMLGFVAWQAWGWWPDKLIPRPVRSSRTAWTACVLAMLINMGVASHCFLLPSYYQVVRQESPLESGLKLLPYLLLITFGIIISGVGVTAVGYHNPFLLFGCVDFLVGAVMLDRINQSTAPGLILGFQVICGFGIGCIQLIPVGVVQQTLDEEYQLEGTALVAMFQFLGSTIGISLSTTVFSQQVYSQLTQAAVPADVVQLILAGLGTPSRLQNAIPPAIAGDVVAAFSASVQQAYKVPIVSGAVALLLACCLNWKRITPAIEHPTEPQDSKTIEKA